MVEFIRDRRIVKFVKFYIMSETIDKASSKNSVSSISPSDEEFFEESI